MHSKNWGFTLIEVLIALAALSVISLTLFNQMSNSSAQLSLVEKRSFARLIAQNTAAELRLNIKQPDGFSIQDRFANQDWRIETSIESTEANNIEKIEIKVFLNDANNNFSDSPSYSLISYRSSNNVSR